MEQTQTPTQTPDPVAAVEDHLSRLAAYEPSPIPVISLYLNTQADDRGRDNFMQWVRNELPTRMKTYPAGSVERESYEQDCAKIMEYLTTQVNPSSNAVAIFACAAAGLFETIQLSAPLDQHYLYVYNQPHLYHLSRLSDEYPRYAVLVTNSNLARIFVFGLGQTLQTETVSGEKMQRVQAGGWSQARYQRRVDNAHAAHAREVVAALDKLVSKENINHIIIAAEQQMAPVIEQELGKDIKEKVVDVIKLNWSGSDRSIFDATLERMKQEDTKTDAEKVERLLGEYRAGGMACVGPEETLKALTNGQVHEMLICASLEQNNPEEQEVKPELAPELPDAQGETASDEPRPALLADLLVTKAKQTDAQVTFIQDPELLKPADGVGAFLRWR